MSKNQKEKKLNPDSMRWDTNGTLTDDAAITEIMFMDEKDTPYFVSALRWSEFFLTCVSEVPLYDLLYWMSGVGGNVEEGMSRIEKHSLETYQAGLDELDEPFDSEYSDEITLVMYMTDCYYNDNTLNADEYLKKYNSGELEISFPTSDE